MTYMFEVSPSLVLVRLHAPHRLCGAPGAGQHLPVLGPGVRRLAAAAAALGGGGGLRPSSSPAGDGEGRCGTAALGVDVPLRTVCVQSALPGLLDQQEITAALRQCNYDPEEVVSVFLALFGDVLLQAPPSRDPTYGELNAFRSGSGAGSSPGQLNSLVS